MAELSSETRNKLPDSAFGWVDGDGVGHFPYKHADGSLDASHARNALARLADSSNVPQLKGAERDAVIAKIKRALGSGSDASKNDDLHAFIFLTKKFSDNLTEDGLTWLPGLPYGQWEHPIHGHVELTPEKAMKMKDNFDSKVMGQELAWNYAHFEDVSKGQRAAGMIEKVHVDSNGLWCGVRLTPTAKKELDDGEWMYTSPEYRDFWEDPRTGEVHEDVLIGGAFTNYPFLKGISPINMSELTLEVADKEHSEPGTGTGGEPAPRTDGDQIASPPPSSNPNGPDFITPPPGTRPEGATEMDEAQLRTWLKIDSETDIEESIKKLLADAEVTRMASRDADKAKKFHELFPDEYETQQKLLARARDEDAKKFADSYGAIRLESGKTVGLAVPARDKIEEVYKKFADGTMTVTDFQETLDTIVKSNTVELGERGSSLSDGKDTSTDDVLKMFGDKQREHILEGKTNEEAMALAVAEVPGGLEAYNERLRGGRR